jgi:outer membrane receptor protein involved in Fe transport
MKHIAAGAGASSIGLALALVAVVLALSTVAYGQVSTGTLAGTITDTTGAVVPNCQISATRLATGEVHTTVTENAGFYSLPSLPPGPYKVSVTHAGFATQVSNLEISIDRTMRLDFSLTVSGTNSTVEVSSTAAEALETESHEVSATVDGVEMEELPQTGRDVFSKLDTTPMVQSYNQSNGGSDISFFGMGGNSLSIGGTTNGNTSYLQDGVLNYNLLTKTANLQPTPEDVTAVNVQANGASARYDEPGVVNVVTKGGSNAFHGQVYEFIENDAFDAKGYFDTQKSQQRYNQFGVSVGGPILKNKLQFFFAYDGLRQHSLATDLELIPTQDMFAGKFGSTVVNDPTTGKPFQDNTIPDGRISSFAKGILAYYPAPNGSYAYGTNYYSMQGGKNNYDSYLGRLDYNLRSSDTMYGAYETTDPVGTDTSWISPATFNWLNVQSATNAYIQETHTFRPTLVNVARFGYNYSKVFVIEAGAGKENYTQNLGVPLVTPSPAYDLPPVVSLSGYSGLSGYQGSGAFNPDGATQKVFQYADELDQVIGKHSIFYGIEADQMNMNASWVLWNNGEFDFNGQYTGNSVADFLLGFPYQAVGGIGYTYGNFNQWQVMPYLQDDWKLTPRLTLNMGLRYDYYQSPNDSNRHAGVFHLETGSVTQGPYSQQYDTLAPRLGVAYALNNNTVLRGGYGIYYSTFMYNELQFMLAHYPNYTLEYNDFGVNQLVPIADTFYTPVPGVTALATFTTAPSMPAPMVQQWNVAFQRSLGSSWSVTLGYLGNKFIHQQQRFNSNQASLPADPNNPTPIQTRRPYPNVGDVYEAGDVGWANYNAFEAELVKRFSKGFSLDANYVWSKALDDQSEDNANPRDGTDLKLDYGPADFDRRQVFKASGIWDIPVGPGRLVGTANNWFNREVIGGWQSSGKLLVLGSSPSSVYANNNADIGADYQEFANQICANPYAANKSRLSWLNNSCFTQPNGTLGNMGRNSLYGPHATTFDASLSKYFPITERLKVKFSADFIDAFNHPAWVLGSGSVASPTSLGQLYDSSSPRVIQFSLHTQF